MTLTDAYGRVLKSIRLIVTNECNYNCFFCHMEGSPTGRPLRIGEDSPSMKPYDYEILAEAAVDLGVRGFKITGGEPLVRDDIVDVVGSLSKADSSLDISMTTNGYLLPELAHALADAGLRRVNISLHTLRREVYRKITGVDGLERTLSGLRIALDHGLTVKINTLVLRGVNDEEVWELIGFAAKMGVAIQLIELIPVGRGSNLGGFSMKLKPIEDQLLEKGAKVEFRDLHNRPVYKLPSGVSVEIVSSPSNPLFCSGCDRIRIDPHGYITPCIKWTGERINILEAVRRAESRREAVNAAKKAILKATWLRRPGYMFSVSDEAPKAWALHPLRRIDIPSRARDAERLGLSLEDL